jgi:hypothetical protein
MKRRVSWGLGVGSWELSCRVGNAHRLDLELELAKSISVSG